jgi:hypothetical protein
MKTVIEMAREAGIRDCTCNGTLGCLERFAELIRDDENEACAEIAHEAEPWCSADLIRARRNK